MVEVESEEHKASDEVRTDTRVSGDVWFGLLERSWLPLRNWRSWLCLLLVWLAVTYFGATQIQKKGVLASAETAGFFKYCMDKYHSAPGSLRLDQPYSYWAAQLPGTDARNYICGALGLLDGKGLAIKEITLQDPNSHTYVPYYYQSPGTPLAIWLVIHFFGSNSIIPYFCFISIVHFLTAISTCILARFYLNRELHVLGVGLLSLLCLPVLDSNFGSGIFWSEPLAAPCLLAALIALALFWRKLAAESQSKRTIWLAALCLGSSLGVASYFRDIYTSFAQFSFVLLIVVAFLRRQTFTKVILFALISMVVFSLVQLPWKIQNLRNFKEFSMSGSSYCYAGFWPNIWGSYKEGAKLGSAKGMGLGDFLAPEKSAEIMSRLAQDKKKGNQQAWWFLLEAICKKPWDALQFKLRVYDMLWLGLPSCPYIYAWCFLSTFGFLTFLLGTRFQFFPDIWLFPLFLLCISPIIHYEHRYSQPFFLLVTPITTIYVLTRGWNVCSLASAKLNITRLVKK